MSTRAQIIAWIGLALAASVLAFTAWLYLAGPWRAVDMRAEAPAPSPSLNPHVVDRAQTRAAFEHEVYGAMPAALEPVVVAREEIEAARAGGVERVEQWRVDVGAAGFFHLAIALPPRADPAPVILVLDFCGNRAAFPERPPAIAGPAGYIQSFCRNGALDPLAEAVFGRHVNGPPFRQIAERGYAVALLYAGDIVPDNAEQARAALARFAPESTGALMAWAWTASRAYEALAADPRFDARRIALFGQSRQGKTALVAGAFDERFAAVVALQSGRGGDAPTNAFAGEPVARMNEVYPHWFTPRFHSETPSVEQHLLLALIAPRPLLLGQARRDQWSDPVGARAVREAAAPAFTALGALPPASYMRGGGHGIHARDWEETLNFLDARMRD